MATLLCLGQTSILAYSQTNEPRPNASCKEALKKAGTAAKELSNKLKPMMDALSKHAAEAGTSSRNAIVSWWNKMGRTSAAIGSKANAAGRTIVTRGSGLAGPAALAINAIMISYEVYVWWDTHIEYQAYLDYKDQPGMSDAEAQAKADELSDLQLHMDMLYVNSADPSARAQAFAAGIHHFNELMDEKRECLVDHAGPSPRDTVGDRGTGDKSGKLGVPNSNHGNGECKALRWVPQEVTVITEEDGTQSVKIIGGYFECLDR